MKGRRFGVENHLGVGGGTVSREAQRNLEKAEDLCRKRKPEKALPYLLKAMEDDNNLDAFIQAAFLFPLPEAVKVLEDAEQKGREGLQRRLGKNCFEESPANKYDGYFYQLLETRPYMRVLPAQVRLYFENGQYDKSAETIIKMLRLCPGDNLGQRYWLGSVLLHCKRPSDALSFARIWLEDRTNIPRGGTDFNTPSSKCFSPSLEEDISKYGNGGMAHTAAIASFKVFDDCDLSRQCLRIAARINPIILTKILAKIEKPRSLNMSARTLNGPEDAQDYLFLTQDLWMEPAVWEWANSVEEAKKILFKTCANNDCGAVETVIAQFKRCAACKEVVYCSQLCQKGDWRTHKPRCQERQQLKETRRAFQSGRPVPQNGWEGASVDFANGMMFMRTG